LVEIKACQRGAAGGKKWSLMILGFVVAGFSVIISMLFWGLCVKY